NRRQPKNAMLMYLGDSPEDWRQWKVRWQIPVAYNRLSVGLQYLPKSRQFAIIEQDAAGRSSTVRLIDNRGYGDITVPVRGIVGGIDENDGVLDFFYCYKVGASRNFVVCSAQLDPSDNRLRDARVIHRLFWPRPVEVT